MKKLILSTLLLLAITGIRTPLVKFIDPIPECPPLCDGGNSASALAR